MKYTKAQQQKIQILQSVNQKFTKIISYDHPKKIFTAPEVLKMAGNEEINLDKVMPILRPLQDLDKPMMIATIPFVPAINLVKSLEEINARSMGSSKVKEYELYDEDILISEPNAYHAATQDIKKQTSKNHDLIFLVPKIREKYSYRPYIINISKKTNNLIVNPPDNHCINFELLLGVLGWLQSLGFACVNIMRNQYITYAQAKELGYEV